MKLDWRVKAAAFRIFDSLPGGRYLHYLTQRYVTRTFPRNLSEHDRWQIEHARTFRGHWGGELAEARLFEFGAGWDLHSSLVQWCFGVNRQFVVDISRLARAEQINHAIDHLRKQPLPGGLRVPERRVGDQFERELQEYYGIRYAAPMDARMTGLPDNSIDLVCTTSVLEHIPREALVDISRECHRICAPGAIVSHVVDYTDHYAHSDPSITSFNFLRFSAEEWRRYNPPIHYQNRMRHFEYGDIFRAAGFRVVSERCEQPADAGVRLAGVRPAPPFASMTTEQLLPGTGHWVLIKDGPTSPAR